VSARAYDIEGFRMGLDANAPGIGRELIRKGGREFAFMWVLREEVKGCTLGYDIGANIGYTTLPIATACEKVFAFEPDKRSRKLLEKNLELNKLGNVLVFKDAVTDHCLGVNIYLSKKPNQSSIARKVGKKKHVSSTTLDTHARFNDDGVFIKMDIEGAEVEAIRGAKKILSHNEHVKILMEIHPKAYGENRDFRETMDILTFHGFRMKYIVNAKGMMDLFRAKGARLIKQFGDYPRAVWAPFNGAKEWCLNFYGGKKIVRSVLWVKG